MSTLAATGRRPRSALYGGGSLEQSPESQLHALRQHAEAKNWVFEEFVDHGVRGPKARRRALGRLVQAVRDAVRAGGLSIGAISRKLKVSRATVRRRLRAAGTS